ncbi:MAG: Tryptophan synthase alpha chain [Labilithrix sp.]|nr:Tryptophan synthase alpha chain [Labilithrix sp.]
MVGSDAGGTPDPNRCASPPCADGEKCVSAGDCSSHTCGAEGLCISATGTDQKKDGSETDVDCGGDPSGASRCKDGLACLAATDCTSGVCKGNVCQAPTHTDGVKNGDETGVDCGGPTSKKACADGAACSDGARDCASGVCTGNVCAAPTHTDGVKNGDETGLDCGGPTAGKGCKDGDPCVVGQGARDCTSKVCTASVCQIPTDTDGVKNGAETDVDCGGGAKTCLAGQGCAANTDCGSKGCNTASKTCAWGRSCTAHNGNDTCGVGDETFTAAAGATFTSGTKEHHDCCESAVVNPDGVAGNSDDFRLDKYQITAGRMRRFIEATSGNVRGWVQNARNNVGGESFKDPGAAAQLPPANDQYLPLTISGGETAPTSPPVGGFVASQPTSSVNVLAHLSGYRFTTEPGGPDGYGCYMDDGSYGARTYWLDNGSLLFSGEKQHLVSQARLDQKVLTCVDYYMLAAFCAWDGGRLETKTEHDKAWGGTTYPWGNDGGTQGFNAAVIDVRYGGSAGNAADLIFNATPAAPGNFIKANLERTNAAWNYSNYFLRDARRYLEGRPTQRTYPGESDVAFVDANTRDQSYAIAPPGRYPSGAGPFGHQDLLGNVIEITADSQPNGSGSAYRWTKNGSYEGYVHWSGPVGYDGFVFGGMAKYGRSGGRCARPLAQP